MPLDLAHLENEVSEPETQSIKPGSAAAEYLGMVEAAPAAPLPPILDAADFMATPHAEPRELVRGVLHQGSKLAVGGGSKSFKTWTLLDLALSVAHGRPWLGHETVTGPVLYLNFEIQNYSWQRRIAAVAKAKGITLEPGAIKLWNLRGHAADFATLLPQVVAQTKEASFALIVLDPIYKLYGRTDENKAGDVAALCNGMENLAVQTAAAVAFGAHFSKGNQAAKEAIDRISGSGVFARDPDSILIFTRHEEEDAFTVDSILRNFAPVAPFAVRWQFPLFQRDDSLDPSRLKQPKGGRSRAHDPRKLLKVIAKTSEEKPISVAKWAHDAGIPRQTLTDYMAEMRKQNFIATVGEGKTARQYITEKGRKHIG